MTYHKSDLRIVGSFLPKFTKEVLMDKRSSRPAAIRFTSNKECVDYTVKMELKYFLARLIYAHYCTSV